MKFTCMELLNLSPFKRAKSVHEIIKEGSVPSERKTNIGESWQDVTEINATLSPQRQMLA